jgi:hypothetical protein
MDSILANYTAQISVPAAATTGIEILFTVGAQTSGTWVIGNAQLEKTTATATTFDFRSYGTELALCQRYYQEACSVVTASSQYVIHLRLPVVMRLGPSVGTITFDSGTGATFGLVSNSGNGTAGLSLYQASNHSAVASATKIPLSAEL